MPLESVVEIGVGVRSISCSEERTELRKSLYGELAEIKYDPQELFMIKNKLF